MKKKWILPELAGILLLLFGGNWAIRGLLGEAPEILQRILFTMVIPYGCLLPGCYLLLRPMEKVPFGKENPLSIRKLLERCVIQTGLSLPVLVVLNLILTVISQPAAPDLDSIRSHMFFYLFLFLVFNPIMEELLFRRLILQRLRPLGNQKALWLSAALFALPHLISQGLPQMGYTFMLGLVWGATALRCNRLRECVLLHAFSNAYCMILPLFLMESTAGMMLQFLLNLVMITSGLFLTVRSRRE